MTRIIGIDPGADGALALWEGGKILNIVPMPTTEVKKGRREVAASLLDDLFELWEGRAALLPEDYLVVMEDVTADPKFGASRSFAMGRNFGAAWACVEVRGYSRVRVAPKTWKSRILAGTDKSKEASIAFAQRLWPTLDLTPPGAKKPSHDWAEAALLAYYGAQFHG